MNAILVKASAMSGPWSDVILRACVEGGIALMLVWFLTRYVHRVPARVKCWLWRLAYLKLLMGLLWAGPIHLPLLRPPHQSATPRPMDASYDSASAIASPAAPALLISASSLMTPHKAPAARAPLPAFALIAWSIAAAALLLRLFIQWRRVSRLRQRCHPLQDEQILRDCGYFARRLRIRAPVEVLVGDCVCSPVTVGLLRPAILLPQALAGAPSAPLRIMLAHELAHAARHDVAWGLFVAVTEALFFFHPLIWLCRRESRLAQEIAADQLAMEITSVHPSDYGHLLLDVAARGLSPATAFVAGIVTSQSALERRLQTMQSLPRWSGRRLSLAAIGIGLVLPVAVPHWKLTARAGSEIQQAGAAALPAGQPPVRPATAATDETGPEKRSLSFSAVLSAANKFRIQARGDGFMESSSVKEGDTVKAGQTLFVLDDQMQKLGVQAAQATLTEKKIVMERKQKMMEKNLAGALEVEEAKIDVEIALARYRRAQQEMDERAIRSPIDGLIEFASPEPRAGEYVTKGTTLATVIGQGDVRAEFQMPPGRRATVKKGAAVQVKINAYPDESFQGSIEFISPEVNPATGTVRVVARIANPNHREVAGMSGRLAVDQGR